MYFFSLSAFEILSLCWTFRTLTMMCYGEVLFWLWFFVFLYSLIIAMLNSSPIVGKFCAIISVNRFTRWFVFLLDCFLILFNLNLLCVILQFWSVFHVLLLFLRYHWVYVHLISSFSSDILSYTAHFSCSFLGYYLELFMNSISLLT